MYRIDKVVINSFWGDKTVTLKFKKDVNFLIGVNGSGKTTIINLIAATLNADFATLDRFQFKKIHINLINTKSTSSNRKESFIEVEKTNKLNSPFQNIEFKIKRENDKKPTVYSLDKLEEQTLIRYPQSEYSYAILRSPHHGRTGLLERNVNFALKELVNVSWLSIHRVSNPSKRGEERGFESAIDLKIRELANEFTKYFSLLHGKRNVETEKFQQFIFESLIESEAPQDIFSFAKGININKERDSLKEIFTLFNLNETSFSHKMKSYFNSFYTALNKLNGEDREDINLKDLFYLLGVNRIHSVVKEWTALIEKQKKIDLPRVTFLDVINSLLQNKSIGINEKNELIVLTKSGKPLALQNLSSGEKQLLIILGQSLLQESKSHIYIADEPELSLHVEWQEKLVSSLKRINPNSQIIFATHSPDIVGSYGKSVIKVETAIK